MSSSKKKFGSAWKGFSSRVTSLIVVSCFLGYERWRSATYGGEKRDSKYQEQTTTIRLESTNLEIWLIKNHLHKVNHLEGIKYQMQKLESSIYKSFQEVSSNEEVRTFLIWTNALIREKAKDVLWFNTELG